MAVGDVHVGEVPIFNRMESRASIFCSRLARSFPSAILRRCLFHTHADVSSRRDSPSCFFCKAFGCALDEAKIGIFLDLNRAFKQPQFFLRIDV